MFQEILADAFVDTAKMAPLLFAIYAGIEFIEYRFGSAVADRVKKAGAWGPFAGALAGIIPQCGFSVIATALFTQRLVTMGTLLAIYLSTSDEALPIILSRPDKIGTILPLILTKFVIALIAGYTIDLIFRKSNKAILEHATAYERGADDTNHHHETVMEEQACCGHLASPSSKKFDPAEIFLHPLIHTLKITAYIFIASVAIALALDQIGNASIRQLFAANIAFGPILAALIGLIPNCAASVAITELYLNDIIVYGTAISGLCASAGLGILVLLKEEKNRKTTATVIGLLFTISVVSGVLIQFLR